MKISIDDLAKIIKEADKEKLPAILQRIFSFKENIKLFAYFFFPHAITTKYRAWHDEFFDMLFSEDDEAEANPRGSGKSTNVGLIFLAFNIVNKLKKYIVYVSETHSKTLKFIQPLRYEFKNNARLRMVYGDLTPKKGRDDDGKDREDIIDIDDSRVEGASFEKNIRGFKWGVYRPDLIILDDIENDERVTNPDLRTKDAEKLNRVIIPSLSVEGCIKFVGTILHLDGLLINKIKQYKGKIRTAVLNNKTIDSPDISRADLLMPDYLTLKFLKKKKDSMGSVAFQQEYMNNPIDTTSSLIKPEWIRQCFDENLSYDEASNTLIKEDNQVKQKYKAKYLGVDFAFSDRATSNNSAYVSLGITDKKVVFHMEYHKGWSAFEQFEHFRDVLHPRFTYEYIAVEENSIKSISKDLDGYGLPLKLFWTAASDPAEKLKEQYYNLKRHTVGKVALITRLGVAFENGQIVLPYKTAEDKRLTNRLFDECVSFALNDGKLVELGVHPDLPIALAFALEVSNMTNFIYDFGDDGDEDETDDEDEDEDEDEGGAGVA